MIGEMLDGILMQNHESVIHVAVPEMWFGQCIVQGLLLKVFFARFATPDEMVDPMGRP